MDAIKNVCIMFSEEDYSLIQQYKKEIEAVSDEVAVLNAICLALDNTDKIHKSTIIVHEG